jgi:hypothetical protein
MARNLIVFMDFSTREVSVVLSRVSTAAARTGRLEFIRRRGIRDGFDDEEDEEEEDDDLRPEKAGMVSVERDTRSDDGLDPW